MSSRTAMVVATGGLITLASAGTAVLVMTGTSSVVPSNAAVPPSLSLPGAGGAWVVVPEAPRAVELPAALGGPPTGPGVRLPGPLDGVSEPGSPVLRPIVGQVPDLPVTGPLPLPEQPPVVQVPGSPTAPTAPTAPTEPTEPSAPPVAPLPPGAVDPDRPDRPDRPRSPGKPVPSGSPAAPAVPGAPGSGPAAPAVPAGPAQGRDDARDHAREARPATPRGGSALERSERVRAALRAEHAELARADREARFRAALRAELATARPGRGVDGRARALAVRALAV